MRRSSLRAWLLVTSGLLAVLVVGGVALTTYVAVSEILATVSYETAIRASTSVAEFTDIRLNDALLTATISGFEGEALDREATRLFFRNLPSTFHAGAGNAEVALYGADLSPVWTSAPRAIIDAEEARQTASDSGQPVETVVVERSVLAGLFSPARLGVYSVHVPFDLPDGSRSVIDVTYFPDVEEAIIDDIRLPMATIAWFGALFMVIMIQVGMGWILKMVNDLRTAADSIGSGHLDVQLPVKGNHEIADLARSLNLLIGRLRHRSTIQTRFVADASHELATPVAGIRGYTNILRAWGAEDAGVRDEAIEAIDRESRRMARLCGDLLTVVRSEQLNQSEAESFDVNESVREVMASAITRYKEKGVNHAGPPDGRLPVVGYPERVEDVLSVLLDNAFKYTPPGGFVTVDTHSTEAHAVIEIADTGMGIPEKDLPNIFERFYRSDESRSKATGGFGLGLAIAKAAVESMGGDVTVRSTLGEGTTFTVLLPRRLPSKG